MRLYKSIAFIKKSNDEEMAYVAFASTSIENQAIVELRYCVKLLYYIDTKII